MPAATGCKEEEIAVTSASSARTSLTRGVFDTAPLPPPGAMRMPLNRSRIIDALVNGKRRVQRMKAPATFRRLYAVAGPCRGRLWLRGGYVRSISANLRASKCGPILALHGREAPPGVVRVIHLKRL
mgnify:FL=1